VGRESDYAEKVHQMSAMDILNVEARAEEGPVNLFVRLRQLAAQMPAQVATVSPQRTASYRKLWSRVERATARLQGEWAVSAGQCVVYEGPPHADALVLWLALCRLGACLLPLEHTGSDATRDAPGMAESIASAELRARAASQATLWLHADDFLPSVVPASIVMRPLSSLIMQPCPYQPVVQHEDGLLDCIEFPSDALLRGGPSRRFSLRELSSQYRPSTVDVDAAGPAVALDQGAFGEYVLGPILLPALFAGRCLVFGGAPLPVAQPVAASLR
jgi:hypothetical protein